MGSMFNGLLGLVILALDIWAILSVIKSNARTGDQGAVDTLDRAAAGDRPDHLGADGPARHG